MIFKLSSQPRHLFLIFKRNKEGLCVHMTPICGLDMLKWKIMNCWWVLVDFEISIEFKYCQVCGEKNPGLLYGGRSCKSCMYFFRRVTFEEISYFCTAADRKERCVEQTDCIKCRRSCRSCRFKVLVRSNWMILCLPPFQACKEAGMEVKKHTAKRHNLFLKKLLSSGKFDVTF